MNIKKILFAINWMIGAAMIGVHAQKIVPDQESPIPFKFLVQTVNDDDALYANPDKEPNLRSAYNKGEDVIVYVKALNDSEKKAAVVSLDYYRPFVPKLEKNGEPVSYLEAAKKEAGKNVKALDPFKASASSTLIFPGETKPAAYLYLKEWYGELNPGAYTLKVIYRTRDGKSAESNIVSFEIKAESK